MRLLLIALTLFVVACGGADTDAPDDAATTTRSAEQTEVSEARATPTTAPTTQPAESATRTIEYVITSRPAAIVSVTYENGSGGTSQEDNVRTPWRFTTEMQTGDFAYVAAQGNEFAAEITCQILVDGGVGASSTSSGQFVIASCDGTVP